MYDPAQLKKDAETIRQSGYFDEDRYRATYPDVDRIGMDPIEHFLRFGRLLGRPMPRKTELQKIIHVVNDLSTIGGVSNRVRLVIEGARLRNIKHMCISAKNEYHLNIENNVSAADDCEQVIKLLSKCTPADTVIIVSNNMLNVFPPEVQSLVKSLPIVYFSAGQMAFFIQYSSIIGNIDYIENFRATKIISLSSGDINFQRQLGIHGQKKGFVPVAQRPENTYYRDNNKFLTYVGRIQFQAKDCMKLVDLAKELAGSDYGPIRIFTTDGRNSPDYERFRREIRDNRLDHMFEFIINERDKE